MTNSKIAIISDIHGNRDALEVVLADIDRREISNVVNLGDCFYGPLDPAGTAELLLKRDFPTVCGNEDRVLFDPRAKSKSSPTLDFTRKALHSEHIQWLKSLPKTRIEFGNYLLCHGTPDWDDEYLLYEVSPDGLAARSGASVRKLVSKANMKQIILCGHSHLARQFHCPDGPLVLNAGSVGLQAYTDDIPSDHQVSAGSPHARYTIFTIDNRGHQIEEVELVYDWDSAAALAEKNGRPDWGAWLRTGLANNAYDTTI